jgi:hypothetical protein
LTALAPALALAALTVDVEGDVVVKVSVDDKLKDAKTSGDADISVAGGTVRIRVRAGKTDGAANVAVGDVDVVVAKDGARVDVRGISGKALSIQAASAMVEVAGKGVESLTVDGKGTSRIEAAGLSAVSATVTLKDAARAEVRATRALDCDLQRAARLVVKGKPANVTKKLAGVAKLVVE